MERDSKAFFSINPLLYEMPSQSSFFPGWTVLVELVSLNMDGIPSPLHPSVYFFEFYFIRLETEALQLCLTFQIQGYTVTLFGNWSRLYQRDLSSAHDYWFLQRMPLDSHVKRSHTIPILILPQLKAFIHTLMDFILFDGFHQLAQCRSHIYCSVVPLLHLLWKPFKRQCHTDHFAVTWCLGPLKRSCAISHSAISFSFFRALGWMSLCPGDLILFHLFFSLMWSTNTWI